MTMYTARELSFFSFFSYVNSVRDTAGLLSFVKKGRVEKQLASSRCQLIFEARDKVGELHPRGHTRR